ncbi:hypothetical protein [Methylosinus sp. C49]|nr:hypothetical protein [Methylosinus sp. C49]
MQTGVVKWFDSRGFGLHGLAESQKISCETVIDERSGESSADQPQVA